MMLINKKNFNLDPYFITGLTDSEGSFSISIRKDHRAKFNRNAGLRYKITMLRNELELLKMVKSFFGCGILLENKDGSVDFIIQDISSIRNKVITHFIKYPLRGTKYLDFLSFKEAFEIIDNKEHLSEQGLNKLFLISKSMNSYRQFSLNMPYQPIHTISNNEDFIPLNGHYVNGFIAGDGCLSLSLLDKSFCKMSLQISQHTNNKILMESIANYFESPSSVYRHDKDSIQISIRAKKLWEEVIFKHFYNYPLYGSKVLRLNKLLTVRELLQDKNYLEKVGKSRRWKLDYKLRIMEIWKN